MSKFANIYIYKQLFVTVEKGMGYRGEIGYQTFLYSNETDIRKVFIFLVEKLPKETTDSTEEALGLYVYISGIKGNCIK